MASFTALASGRRTTKSTYTSVFRVSVLPLLGRDRGGWVEDLGDERQKCLDELMECLVVGCFCGDGHAIARPRVSNKSCSAD